MNILYITSSFEDYLQDVTFIGLRNLFGSSVVDFPKKDVLYSNCSKDASELYGCGFTVWKILDDIGVDRENVIQRVLQGEFEFVVFGSIWRQKDIFATMQQQRVFAVKNVKFAFLDGEDHTRLYKPAVRYGNYFKREKIGWFRSLFSSDIGFSIPDIKVREQAQEKIKTFAMHVQCDEAYKIEEIQKNCQKKYAFSTEADYYHDIAVSKYAVTMKKAGWDCMRHYEIAANLTVPCFYLLDEKPKNCAPHGLVDMHNVVTFNSADELLTKLDVIESSNLYPEMQSNVRAWIAENKSSVAAQKLLRDCGFVSGGCC